MRIRGTMLLVLFALFILPGVCTSAQTPPAAEFGAIDAKATTNGACNAPEKSCTTYADVPPARKETIMIVAWWAGRSLTATASDGVNTYVPVAGPTDVPDTPIRAEVWYAVNRGSPMGFTIALNGASQVGAFDGIFVQVVSMKGLDPDKPLDMATVRTNTGTGSTLKVSSGVPVSPNELMWGVFLSPSAGTPWTFDPSWTSASGQEAVSQSIFKRISSTMAVTPELTTHVSLSWIAFTFGFK